MSNSGHIVSAVISTYNAERFIGPCIEDLENQTIADQTEIIVVDSASPQNEGAIVRSYQQKYDNIRYIRSAERESVYGAWNRGIAIAQGKYITNANTDDRHRQDAFERMASVLDTRPNIALVYADVYKTEVENQVFDQCRPSDRFKWYDWDRKRLLKKGCFMGPQPMWRRDVHDVFGHFNDGLISSGDFEFWLRISQLFEFQHLKIPLGLYLKRETSVEHANSDLKIKEDLAIQAEYLQAAVHKRLIHCQLLERLRTLIDNETPSASQTLIDCMADLEHLICPDFQGRSISARNETDNFLKLKYRILSGMVTPAQVDQVIETLAQLLLDSTRWYRRFWKETLGSKPTVNVSDNGSATVSSHPSQKAGCQCGVGGCKKDQGFTLI